MKKNRFLVFLLALVMMMASLPAMAEEEEPEKHISGNFTYILLDDGTAEIVEYSSVELSAEIVIPDELDGYVVSSIAGNPFRSSDDEVVYTERFIVSPDNPYFYVSDGVLFCKTNKSLIAFPCNSSINMYTIPEGVISIGAYAFYDCKSLQRLTIPEGVTSIGEEAFHSCHSLQSISFPDSITSIGDLAFVFCNSLRSITIPDSVTSIGGNPFMYCSDLTEIIISSNHPCLEVKDDVLFYKNGSEMRLVTYPYALRATEYSVPDGVTSIGDNAFACSMSLRNVIIPDSVTSIGEWAFWYCESLQSIIIPDSVTSIGARTFSHCTSLQSITIPDSVTSIGKSAFFDCTSLQSIIISDNLISIGDEAFSSCFSLQNVTIPDSVTSIGGWAFANCDALQSITIPDSVTSIGGNPFMYCDALTEIIVSSDHSCLEFKDGGLFYKNGSEMRLVTYLLTLGATEYSIPDGVTSIGDDTFSSCKYLQSITIPDSVTSIGDYAFYNCKSLQCLLIPDSVTSIGDSAFKKCPNNTLIVTQGSYAETYAIDNGLNYTYPETYAIDNGRTHIYTDTTDRILDLFFD